MNRLNKYSEIVSLLRLKPMIQDLYNYSYNEQPLNEDDFVNGKVVNFKNSKYKLYYKELIDDCTHCHRITFNIKQSETRTTCIMHFIE
jgi:hypothetical protein